MEGSMFKALLRRNRAFFGAALAAGVWMTNACARDLQTPVGPEASEALSPAAVHSSYVLRRLDGAPLPRRICPNESLTVTGGSLLLHTDRRFNLRIRYRTHGTTEQVEATGTYRVEGKKITFRESSSGVTTTGDLSDGGARLTVSYYFCDPPTKHTATFVRQ
jgi:hypothetical protein